MFKVYFHLVEPNPEYIQKLEALNAFLTSHPRLAFEPRSLSEIEDGRTYSEMKADFDSTPKELPPVEASGILVQTFYNDTFIVLYNQHFVTLTKLDIVRAEYLGPDPREPVDIQEPIDGKVSNSK